jgi:hypothetical protein
MTAYFFDHSEESNSSVFKLRAVITRSTPSRANCSAIALPIPPEAPVTNAVFRFIFFSLSNDHELSHARAQGANREAELMAPTGVCCSNVLN